MKNNFQRIIMTCVIVTTLTGCDPVVGYEYHVKNLSDSALLVTFKANRDATDNIHILRIASHADYLIYKTEIWGSHPHDEQGEFLKLLYMMKITHINKSSIGIDVNKRKNWKYKNRIIYFGVIKTGTNIYTLNLTNADVK